MSAYHSTTKATNRMDSGSSLSDASLSPATTWHATGEEVDVASPQGGGSSIEREPYREPNRHSSFRRVMILEVRR